MADKFLEDALREYSRTMREMALKANLHRAAGAVKSSQVSPGRGKVYVPNDEAPNARVFNSGLRHPLNYPTQIAAQKGGSSRRPFARTPKRPFLEWVRRDIGTADRALNAGIKDVIENDWNKGF